MLNRFFRTPVALAVVALSVSLSVNAASDLEFAKSLAPPDAGDIGSQSTADGFQIYFTVDRKFPDLGLIPNWKDALNAAGWHICQEDVESSEMFQWSQHVDATKEPRQIVKRYMAIFAKGTSAALVVARYKSAFNRDTAGNLNSIPDNDRQSVNLAFFQRSSSAIEVSGMYKVNCN